jgi:hypothetical protein
MLKRLLGKEEEMLNLVKSATVVAVILACCGGDLTAQGRGRGGPDKDRGSYFHQHGYTRLNIPKGHYPPPGQCRIWYPGKPPGHQPPPGNCNRLRAEVPPGAWLIRHPQEDRDHVHIAVYDERRPNTVLVVGQFNIGSGIFVRIVVDK